MEIYVGMGSDPARPCPADMRWIQEELAAQAREWMGTPMEWKVGIRTTNEQGWEVPFEMRHGWRYRIEQQ
jgi:hypothetical protein